MENSKKKKLREIKTQRSLHPQKSLKHEVVAFNLEGKWGEKKKGKEKGRGEQNEGI